MPDPPPHLNPSSSYSPPSPLKRPRTPPPHTPDPPSSSARLTFDRQDALEESDSEDEDAYTPRRRRTPVLAPTTPEPPSTPSSSGRSSPTTSTSSPTLSASSFSSSRDSWPSSPPSSFSPLSSLAFDNRSTRTLRHTSPTGDFLVPPSPGLLRPTTFWKNAYRTALGETHDAPSASLVRCASFIAAGHEVLLPLRGDELASLVQPRPRDRVRVILPPEAVDSRAYY